MSVQKRGWSIGRSDVGQVTFEISPLTINVLPSFHIPRCGSVTCVHVTILAVDSSARQAIKAEVTAQLHRALPAAAINFLSEGDSGGPKRTYLLMVAETESGCRLGRDWLYEGNSIEAGRSRKKAQVSDFSKQAKDLVNRVIVDLQTELAHGGSVDSFMQDQLVIFQTLAQGTSTIDHGSLPETLHTLTARWSVSI